MIVCSCLQFDVLLKVYYISQNVCFYKAKKAPNQAKRAKKAPNQAKQAKQAKKAFSAKPHNSELETKNSELGAKASIKLIPQGSHEKASIKLIPQGSHNKKWSFRSGVPSQ